MDNTRERRTYIRVELPVECTILFAGKKLPGECLNISATGMSIAVKTSVSLNIGDEVEIQLEAAVSFSQEEYDVAVQAHRVLEHVQDGAVALDAPPEDFSQDEIVSDVIFLDIWGQCQDLGNPDGLQFGFHDIVSFSSAAKVRKECENGQTFAKILPKYN